MPPRGVSFRSGRGRPVKRFALSSYKKESKNRRSLFNSRVRRVIGQTLEKKHVTLSLNTPLNGLTKNSMISSLDTNWNNVDFSPIIPVGTAPYQREGAQVWLKSVDIKMTFINPFNSYGFVRMILVAFKDDPQTAVVAGINPIQWLYRQNTGIAVNLMGLNTPVSNYTKVRKVLIDRTFNVTPQTAGDVNYTKHIKKHIKLGYIGNFNSAEEVVTNRTVGPTWLYMFLSAYNYAGSVDEPILFNYGFKYSFNER